MYERKEKFYKYRPDYSKKSIEYISGEIDNRNILEVGAGPGNLTKQLLEGTRLEFITTIEPNLKFIELQKINLSQYISQGRCLVKQGVAENLCDAKADVVICGTSLHWFEENQFFKEFSRTGAKTLIVMENWADIDKIFFREWRHTYNNDDVIHYYQSKMKFRKKSFLNFLNFKTFEAYAYYMLSMSYAPISGVQLSEYLTECGEYWKKYHDRGHLCINGTTNVWVGSVL